MYIFVENRTLVAFDLCLGPFSKALRKNGSPMVDPWLTTDFKQAQAPGMAIFGLYSPMNTSSIHTPQPNIQVMWRQLSYLGYSYSWLWN